MNYDVMIYALKVVRNHEFSGQVRMLSPSHPLHFLDSRFSLISSMWD